MAFAETFGIAGTGVYFFSGQWWLLGLFLLLIFITFLMAYKVNVNGIVTVLVLGLISISAYQLYFINEQITQTILLFVFIFIGSVAYLFLSR